MKLGTVSELRQKINNKTNLFSDCKKHFVTLNYSIILWLNEIIYTRTFFVSLITNFEL